MKNVIIIINVILLLGCVLNRSTTLDPNKVFLLNATSPEIDKILGDVRNAYTNDYVYEDQVFVLRTERLFDKLEVIISIYEKDDFGYCFKDLLFPLFGVMENDEITLLVYGESSHELFRKKNDYKYLSYLKCKGKNSINDQSGIPYPPVSFEPNVWIYEGDTLKLDFKEMAQFNLIE